MEVLTGLIVLCGTNSKNQLAKQLLFYQFCIVPVDCAFPARKSSIKNLLNECIQMIYCVQIKN